jgi:hypothetical protein
MAWLTKPRFAGTVLTARPLHAALPPCGLRSHRLRDMSFAPKPKIPLRGYRAYSPAAARSAWALSVFGLRSHWLRQYELRPKTDALLTQGGLTAQQQHGVLLPYRFFPT